MADYWKSLPKKFCEYCKCWITDNKGSVNFHENGKKHKANVQTKLTELRKKGESDQRDAQRVKSQLAQMEAAALKALQRDISADPSMADQYRSDLQTLSEQKAAREAHAKAEEDQRRKEEAKRSKVASQAMRTVERATTRLGSWVEATSPQGTYYWNSTTGATQWEKPLSMADTTSSIKQEDSGISTSSDPASSTHARQQIKTESRLKQEVKSEPAQTVAAAAKIVMKTKKVNAGTALGTWQTVEEPKETKELAADLQLPASKPAIVPKIALLGHGHSAPAGLFKEKSVSSLSTGSGCATGQSVTLFKKRKQAASAASATRNVRKRTTDN